MAEHITIFNVIFTSWNLAAFSLALVVASIIISFTLKIISIKKSNGEMLTGASILCKELDEIVNSLDTNDVDECYEAELSLRSYFHDNKSEFVDLIYKLKNHRSFFYRKNKSLLKISKLLEWIMNEFYLHEEEEDERIRIWSQNVDTFNHKYLKSFDHSNDNILKNFLTH